MKRNRIVLPLLIVALASWYIFWYDRGDESSVALLEQIRESMVAQETSLSSSGVVQAHEVRLSLPTGGRVARVMVNESDAVEKGQKLLELDRSLYNKQVAVAQARVRVAQAALEHARAGARPGQTAIAAAELEVAKAGREAAKRTSSDLLLLRDNPQELDLQIAVAEAQLVALGHRLEQAMAAKDAAEESVGLYQYLQDLIKGWSYPVPAPVIPMSLKVAPYDRWKSWINVNVMQESLKGQSAQLEYLRDVRSNPQELEGQIDEARAAVLQTAAAVDAAQAKLDGYRAGASREQLDTLKAQLGQARAALDALLAQEDDMNLFAPMDGIVLSQVVHEGEVLSPGTMALVLGDLSQVTVTVYVPEPDLGRVRIGQMVEVTVDAWPGRAFEGEVTYVAGSAEYTPRNVATQEGRMLTYYGVDIVVDNEAGDLKPGMPADVVFQ